MGRVGDYDSVPLKASVEFLNTDKFDTLQAHTDTSLSFN